MKITLLAICCLMNIYLKSQDVDDWYPQKNYTKQEVYITMRDGVKLFTAIYIPKDSAKNYPFLMERTPYSVSPYGLQNYATSLGPNISLMVEKYIFVYQDVRGRYMSEGHNLEMTPYIENKKSKTDVDESSDTYDTIDWLLKNIKNNNGRVGLYGISYPGFYAAASLPGAHPAIKAVSPQAPVTDEFIGDDANHNGAFFLLDNFDFMNYFGKNSDGPTQDYGSRMFRARMPDAYIFFLNLGPLKNTQSVKYFNHESYIWNEYLQHDTYDSFWQKRNIRPHLKNIKAAVMVVGGWFDAEDLFGALHTYEAIEKQNPVNKNYLVMGPWTHGAWSDDEWNEFGTYTYDTNINKYYKDSLETKFFNYYLKDEGNFNASEATVFETGTNKWEHFNKWPPANMKEINYYFGKDHHLSTKKQLNNAGFDQYASDPANPVPYTNGRFSNRNDEYMVEDQRFTVQRPDVLVYETDTLTEDVTIAGRIIAKLSVSITGTDADFIVKVIDVLPSYENSFVTIMKDNLSDGFERLVRAEVMRGKFRNSYENPEPFTPNKISEVDITLNDVLHTFKKGHRIMVQVQSSWFPLVDMNPQKFISIPAADEKDFEKATIKIYRNNQNQSKLILPVLKN